jgi:hypothetical protein
MYCTCDVLSHNLAAKIIPNSHTAISSLAVWKQAGMFAIA